MTTPTTPTTATPGYRMRPDAMGLVAADGHLYCLICAHLHEGRPVVDAPPPAAECHRCGMAMTKAAHLARLRVVFEMVKNDDHWKNPIDALVPLGAATEEELWDAVVHYTGSVPEITRETVAVRHVAGLTNFDDTALRVRAAGYYAAIGA